LKIVDTAWSCEEGEVLIQKSLEGINLHYPITTENHSYTIEGKHYKGDLYPVLFRSKQEFLEYWGLGATLEVVESNQLTKREMFAMAAMQGLLASPDYLTLKWETIADYSVDAADALLTKLKEKQ
jgi:hypothetical protein